MNRLPKPPRGFRHVPGFPGYAVNRKGAVVSCRRGGRPGDIHIVSAWHAVRPLRMADGYHVVHVYVPALKRKTVGRVHRFVLLAFVGPCPPRQEGCHRNGDRNNNRLTNLRWGTRSSNLYDRVRHGHIQYSERHAKKLSLAAVRVIRASSAPRAKLAKRFNVHVRTITRVRLFQSWHILKRSPR